MGKVFFVDWALWQKMTFVLACAIVLTIAIGYMKVLYTNRKLKKLSKPVGARADQEPQMVEAAVPKKSEEDVPFGIRAIQSGIEVDGIWISGTNTPVPSSPTQSAQDKAETSASASSSRPISTLEIPPAAIASSSRPSSHGPPSSNFDRAVSAERLTNHSRDSSPGSTASGQRARQHRPPPSAYSRYSQGSMLRHSATLDTLEGEGSEIQTVTERPGSGDSKAYNFTSAGSSRKSSGSSDKAPGGRGSSDEESGYLEVGKAQVMASPRPRDPRTDLRLLHNHRLSHVAETGVLARRERPLDRPLNRSGDWGSITLDTPQARSAPNSGPPSPPSDASPPSPPTPPMAQGSNPFVAPLESVNSPTRDSHPDNTAAHAVPLLETYQPRMPNFDDDMPQTFQHGRESQVLRKVNSGFEILRPGTFPVGPTEDLSRAQPKKLQKKRRPSTDSSRVSSFVEQV